jgi:hypothetical protein
VSAAAAEALLPTKDKITTMAAEVAVLGRFI